MENTQVLNIIMVSSTLELDIIEGNPNKNMNSILFEKW